MSTQHFDVSERLRLGRQSALEALESRRQAQAEVLVTLGKSYSDPFSLLRDTGGSEAGSGASSSALEPQISVATDATQIQRPQRISAFAKIDLLKQVR